jgi:hypothetical protein
MWRHMGREIQLNRREMVFSWISVSGNGGMGRNHGREIQLKRRRMMFLRISVGWWGECGRIWGEKSSWSAVE